MTPQGATRRVDVTYHWESEGWWAECGDMPGWSATAATRDDLRRLVHEAVALHFGRPAVTVAAFLVDKVNVPGLRVDPAGRETLEVRP